MKLWNRILCAVLGHKLREVPKRNHPKGRLADNYYACVRCGKKAWWLP